MTRLRGVVAGHAAHASARVTAGPAEVQPVERRAVGRARGQRPGGQHLIDGHVHVAAGACPWVGLANVEIGGVARDLDAGVAVASVEFQVDKGSWSGRPVSRHAADRPPAGPANLAGWWWRSAASPAFMRRRRIARRKAAGKCSAATSRVPSEPGEHEVVAIATDRAGNHRVVREPALSVPAFVPGTSGRLAVVAGVGYPPRCALGSATTSDGAARRRAPRIEALLERPHGIRRPGLSETERRRQHEAVGAGKKLIGGGRRQPWDPARARAPASRQIEPRDQTVVAATDDDRVVVRVVAHGGRRGQPLRAACTMRPRFVCRARSWAPGEKGEAPWRETASSC